MKTSNRNLIRDLIKNVAKALCRQIEFGGSPALPLRLYKLCFLCSCMPLTYASYLQPDGQTPEERQLRDSLEEEREAVLAFLYNVIDCVSHS